MRYLRSLPLLLIAALLYVGLGLGALHAQPASGSQVYWNGSRADTATAVGTSATSAATITITPAAGQFVYVTGLDITNCAGASAVTAAAPTTLTTTNLTGSPAWTIGSGVTAGQCQPNAVVSLGAGLKSTVAGTAVTFVLPTFATNQTVRVNVYYYTAL